MRWIAAILVTALSYPVIAWWRGYPWPMTLAVALALGGLAWATVRTTQRLWALRRPAEVLRDRNSD